MSDSQLSLVLFTMRELGVDNIPSLKTFRRVQVKMREKVSVTTERKVSSRGNIFHANNIGSIVAKV